MMVCTPTLALWTFTLWLTFQQDRTDAVGAMARYVHADPNWPGRHSLEGLTRYLREQGAPQKQITALHRAWEEWRATQEKG